MSKTYENSNIVITDEELMEIFGEIEEDISFKENQKVSQEINTSINSLILEAVKHFSKRFRKGEKGDFDERYFYCQRDVDKFFELNTNPKVKVRKEYDKKFPDKVFCYILYR